MKAFQNEPRLNLKTVHHLQSLPGELEANSLFDELITLFAAELPQRLTRLEAAKAKSAFGDIFQIAHALKSSSGSLGMTRAMKICEALEDFAENQDLDALHECVGELAKELKQACTELKALKGKKS